MCAAEYDSKPLNWEFFSFTSETFHSQASPWPAFLHSGLLGQNSRSRKSLHSLSRTGELYTPAVKNSRLFQEHWNYPLKDLCACV